MLSLILMLTMSSLTVAPKAVPADVKLAQIETCQWPKCSRPSQALPEIKSFKALAQIETCQWPRCFKAG